MNLAWLLHRAAALDAGRPAVAWGDTVQWHYGDLATRVARLAAGLRAHGLRPGDAVAVVMANRPEYLETLFSIWHAGLIAVPINAKLHPAELRWILGDAGARVCVSAGDLVAAAREAVDDGGTVVDVEGETYAGWAAAEPMAVADEVRGDATAWLFYTSGTTGRPKGAMLSHRNLLAMTTAYVVDVDPIDGGHAWIHAAPMSHGSGLYALPFVAVGGLNVVPRSGSFDPEELYAAFARWPNASLFFAPTMVHRLLRHAGEPAGLRTIVYGGGPMYLEDLREALGRFGPRFAQIYGQGEAPMTITAVSRAMHAEVDHPDYWDRLATVGVARTGVEVRVVDGEGQPVAPGEVGEVVCRGDVVMKGYHDDPAATAKTLRGGWLHTGDLGRLDDRGWLTLAGRAHDMIISGGSNIYPREVEEVLLADPSVAEVAVVGVPDPEWGERVEAHVVAAAGHTIDPDALDRRCLDRLARFKRPRAYHVRPALPKNAYGKVRKDQLRKDQLS